MLVVPALGRHGRRLRAGAALVGQVIGRCLSRVADRAAKTGHQVIARPAVQSVPHLPLVRFVMSLRLVE